MCVTLLLASLLCLTLPGKYFTSPLSCSQSFFTPPFLSVLLFLSPSVCGSLADVFVDGQCHGSRAVHSSQWSVRLLAVHSSRHRAAVLDATGTDHHHDQSPRVDTHGNKDVSLVLPANGKYSAVLCYIANDFNVYLGGVDVMSW